MLYLCCTSMGAGSSYYRDGGRYTPTHWVHRPPKLCGTAIISSQRSQRGKAERASLSRAGDIHRNVLASSNVSAVPERHSTAYRRAVNVAVSPYASCISTKPRYRSEYAASKAFQVHTLYQTETIPHWSESQSANRGPVCSSGRRGYVALVREFFGSRFDICEFHRLLTLVYYAPMPARTFLLSE